MVPHILQRHVVDLQITKGAEIIYSRVDRFFGMSAFSIDFPFLEKLFG